MCYSPVRDDARVSKQIRWLEAAGYVVDVLSRGPEHPDATGRALRISEPTSRLHLRTLALLPLPARFRGTIERYIPTDELASEEYDLVVVNDHHLLPWVVKAAPRFARGPVVLDLHELYADNGVGLVHRFVYGRWDSWLLTFISSPVFTHHMTVADGIADIYHDDYGLPRPTVIRNVAPYEPLEPSSVDPDRIVLVHHGYAAVERGIDIMLDAALLLEPRFEVTLMVLSTSSLSSLRAHPAITSGRVTFREPVGVLDVARTLNEFDLEMIFFPPRFPNNAHALPNKFFEAIQGRLGIVVGESPEIVPFVREYGLGVVVEGWTAADLAATINSLTVEQITAMKRASARAAEELSAESEGKRFLAAVRQEA
jgi:hypothetical protein